MYDDFKSENKNKITLYQHILGNIKFDKMNVMYTCINI